MKKCMENIQEKIKSFGEWAHLIDLDEGVYTIPQSDWLRKKDLIAKQHYIARTLLPFMCKLNDQNTSETTVLDLGCMDGWLSVLLQRAGYKKITGVDASGDDIRKALFVRDVLGMDNVEFYQSDLFDWQPKTSFDFVVMLGVLNHVNDPVGVLKHIHSMTKRYFILDLDLVCHDDKEPPEAAKKRLHLSQVFGSMTCHFETGGASKHPGRYELVYQYSKRAVVMMLQYAGFKDILEIMPRLSLPDMYVKDRVFLIAEKNDNKDGYLDELIQCEHYRGDPFEYLSDIHPIPIPESSTDVQDQIIMSKPIEENATSVGDTHYLKRVYKQHLNSLTGQKVLVWGTSGFYNFVKDIFNDVTIEAFVDNDTSKVGTTIDGIAVISPEALNNMPVIPVFICSNSKEEILLQIKRDYPKFTLIP